MGKLWDLGTFCIFPGFDVKILDSACGVRPSIKLKKGIVLIHQNSLKTIHTKYKAKPPHKERSQSAFCSNTNHSPRVFRKRKQRTSSTSASASILKLQAIRSKSDRVHRISRIQHTVYRIPYHVTLAPSPLRNLIPANLPSNLPSVPLLLYGLETSFWT